MPSWLLTPLVTIYRGSTPPLGNLAGTTCVRTISPSRKSLPLGGPACALEGTASRTVAIISNEAVRVVLNWDIMRSFLVSGFLLVDNSCLLRPPGGYQIPIIPMGCYTGINGIKEQLQY